MKRYDYVLSDVYTLYDRKRGCRNPIGAVYDIADAQRIVDLLNTQEESNAEAALPDMVRSGA